MEDQINQGGSIKNITNQTADNSPSGLIGMSGRFAAINRLILRDLNQYGFYDQRYNKGFFTLFTKEDIAKYLVNPAANEKNLRRAVQYLYAASSHFRRLIQYFVGLSDLSYIVQPYKINPKEANIRTTSMNYHRVLNTLSSMNIKTQFPKILKTCLLEDVFYGTMWVTDDNITIQQLPSDYCQVQSIEGNVMNVAFNFSYFSRREAMLESYPPEFRIKYERYKGDKKHYKWIDLDSPTSFAIKCNNDIPEYAIPPFAGILREIYDIEDYKQLKLTKTALENYALIYMTLPYDDEGGWKIDYEKAYDFYHNLDNVLPDEIGSVLTPMEIGKISFERSNDGDENTITNAEQNLFTAAGVSSLLFNNEKASANALLLSIKADQAITYGIVKSIEDMVNRFIQSLKYGKNFKVNFLDVSPFNRKEVGEAYLKAASYGIPTISAYAASQGINQAELDSMSFLETKIMSLQKMFKPLISSSQLSSDTLSGNGATDEGGAPQKDMDELTDSGEQSAEDKDDWG